MAFEKCSSVFSKTLRVPFTLINEFLLLDPNGINLKEVFFSLQLFIFNLDIFCKVS